MFKLCFYPYFFLFNLSIAVSQNNIIATENYKKEYQTDSLPESNVFETRYYLNHNALPIKRGKHYSLVHLWGPEVNFNITKSTSIGFMSTWIASPFGLSIKQNFKPKNEKLNFSIGALTGSMGYLTQGRGYGGVFLGTATLGTYSSNISISTGVSVFKSAINYRYNITKTVIDTIQSYYSAATGPLMYERPSSTAILFAISGMKNINSELSLVFDLIYTNSKVTIPTGNNIIIYGTYKDAKNDKYYNLSNFKRNYIILMPSFRFKMNQKSSIQISLSVNGSFDKYKKQVLPIPMWSWFKKF